MFVNPYAGSLTRISNIRYAPNSDIRRKRISDFLRDRAFFDATNLILGPSSYFALQ